MSLVKMTPCSRGNSTQSRSELALRASRGLAVGLASLLLSPVTLAEEGSEVGTSKPAPAPVVPLDKLFELPSGFEARKAPSRAGFGATEWRARFSEARQRVERSTVALAGAKRELAELAESSNAWAVAPPVGGIPNSKDSPLNYQLSQRIKQDQREVDAAKRNLLDLEVSANLAGVPDGWRRERGPELSE